jgi:hypothetical protein
MKKDQPTKEQLAKMAAVISTLEDVVLFAFTVFAPLGVLTGNPTTATQWFFCGAAYYLQWRHLRGPTRPV